MNEESNEDIQLQTQNKPKQNVFRKKMYKKKLKFYEQNYSFNWILTLNLNKMG